MRVNSIELATRLIEITKDYEKKVSFQVKAQQVISFVESLPFNPSEDSFVNATVGTSIFSHITLTAYEVSVDDAIENILGPIHREFDVDWEMSIDSYNDAPEFTFKSIAKADEIFFWIRVIIRGKVLKECKLERKLVRVQEAYPIYEYSIDCMEKEEK